MRILEGKSLGLLSFHVALFLAVFIFSNILISSLFFIAHVSISPLQPLLATITTVIFMGIILRKYGKYVVGSVFALALLLIGSSLYITSITSDDTVDAHGYHETAVGAMRYGWNPVYEHVGDFNESGKSPIKLQDNYYEKWNDHYPKAHWIYAANIYSVTGKIETGRSMALLVIFVLFFLVLHYALIRFSFSTSIVLAFVTAFNPISVMQMFSYYNDGMMGNLLLIAVIIFTMLLDKKYRLFKWPHHLLLIIALSVMINLKFTGLVYGGIYGIAYLIYVITSKHGRQTALKPLLITAISTLLIGVFVIGLSVYLKNYFEKGSPFYPLLGGSSETNIIKQNEPYQFHDMKNIKKLFISNFSETDNISESSGRDPKLKIPLTFSLSELSYLSYVDPRIAGYGVWFSGALTISFLWLLYISIKLITKKRSEKFWLLVLPLIPTAIIALFVSEAWWARYFPQLFLVPAVALVSMILYKRQHLKNILMFILLFNTIVILSLQISGQREGLAYRASEEKAVDALLENGKYTPKLYLGDFGGLAYRYYEKYGRVIILTHELDTEGPQDSLRLAKNIIVYK